ncbi:fork-head transcriptional regulator 2-like isoform X3 [Colossoma macropomum]|uniref:fork-head transcriptional regulator 2-like isoform X3 n=1 Tax=Colossoma macropomum TaxID=42526 RepID=UPI001863BECF|nr:fork-head transcriptional regulator 2-like isoform X3 [Colossoma macropomum]
MAPRVTILFFSCLLLFAIKSTLADSEANGNSTSPSQNPTVTQNVKEITAITTPTLTISKSPQVVITESKSASSQTLGSAPTSTISPTVNTTGNRTTSPTINTSGTLGKDKTSPQTEGPQTTQTAATPKPGPRANPESDPSKGGSVNETDSSNDIQTHGPQSDQPISNSDKNYYWLLLLVGVAGIGTVMYFKCCKTRRHAETTDSGTENASFQRTESNKDGVMLLGVKSSGGAENAAAK